MTKEIIYPEFRHTDAGYFHTTLRLHGKDGYYLMEVNAHGLDKFIKQVYCAMYLHEYDPTPVVLFDGNGNNLNPLDDIQITETERLMGKYFSHIDDKKLEEKK